MNYCYYAYHVHRSVLEILEMLLSSLLVHACMLVPAELEGGRSKPPRVAVSPNTAPQRPRYLSSFAYTISNDAPAHRQMWTADDFVTMGTDGKERPWQNLILVTGYV